MLRWLLVRGTWVLGRCASKFYVNFKQLRGILEKRTSDENTSPPDWPMDKTVVHFLD